MQRRAKKASAANKVLERLPEPEVDQPGGFAGKHGDLLHGEAAWPHSLLVGMTVVIAALGFGVLHLIQHHSQ